MEKLYDLKNILAVHNDDMDFVKTMAELFIELLPPISKELKTATDKKDFGKMHFNAHKLKASIDLFSVTSIEQIIRKLEEHGKNKVFSNELPKEAEYVNKIINECAKALKQDLQLQVEN